MPYQSFVDAFEELGSPIRKLSDLYETSRTELDSAAKISDDGSVSVDFGALRKALDILPPGNEERIDRATGGLDHGFAMIGKQPVPLAPWSAFQDAGALRPFGPEFWRALGFLGAKARPFRGIAVVPDEVRDAKNMAMLQALATSARAYPSSDPGALMVAAGTRHVWHLEPRNTAYMTVVPPADTASTDTGTSTLALKPEDFKGIIDCLTSARYSFTGFGFILSICVDRKCADTIQDLLSLGTGSLLAAGLSLITTGITTAAISAAVTAVGGWIAFFILISAAYWALMIQFNKTPRGVCLNIPMPWSFGIIGPGWATGI